MSMALKMSIEIQDTICVMLPLGKHNLRAPKTPAKNVYFELSSLITKEARGHHVNFMHNEQNGPA